MGKTLGELEQMILLAVISLGDDAYGASIRREIASRTGKDISPGAVYTVLERLEAAGLVVSRVGTPTPTRGGRRRKHYEIRPDGARSLKATQERMRRMAEGLHVRIDDLAMGGDA